MLPVRVQAKSGRVFELALDDSMTVADLEEALDFHHSDYRLIQDNRLLEGTLPLKSLRKSRKAAYIDLKLVPRSLKNLPRPRTPCTTEGSSFVFDGFSWYMVHQNRTTESTVLQEIANWVQTISPNDIAEFIIKLFLGVWILKDQIGLQAGVYLAVSFILLSSLQTKFGALLRQFFSRYWGADIYFTNGFISNVVRFIASMFPEFEHD